MSELLDAFRAGDRGALSRVLTAVEREAPGWQDLFDSLYTDVGQALRIGITGAPGAGKSTLISALVKELRARQMRVGVVAVDPTSPVSGGALLGDRVRMEAHLLDDGVFIRSMATRGSHGGIAPRAPELVDVFDAAGFDVVFCETVGVGQVAVDVGDAVDIVVVVVVPGAGDSIQTMKAGLLETADVFVLNKADQPDADRLEQELREMLELRVVGSRDVTICRTTATEPAGVEELLTVLEELADRRRRDGSLETRRAEQRLRQVRRLVEEQLSAVLWGRGGVRGLLADAVEDSSNLPPNAQARAIVETLVPEVDEPGEPVQ